MANFMVILLQKREKKVTSITAAAIRENSTTEFFFKKTSIFYTAKAVKKDFVEYILRNKPEIMYIEEGRRDVFIEMLKIIFGNGKILRMNNNTSAIEFINMPSNLEGDFDRILKAYRDLLKEGSKVS